MTSEGINRQPQGIPAGGQFAPHQHPEAPIRLFNRTDGTYENPAPSSTAEHCIQFWSTVEIPDAIIDQAHAAYGKMRSDEIDRDMAEAMTEWRAEWETQNPVPKQRHLTEYQERFKAEYEQYRLSILPMMEAKRPNGLGEYDVVQLVRAAKMAIHRPHPEKFPEEEQKVLREKVELFDEELTVFDIEQKYGLMAIGEAIRKVHRKDTDALLEAMDRQSEQLSGIREQIVYQRSDLNGY